ncbi:MAG: formyl-CoA transferase [Candidatus Tectimicrobiota bacterium]|nr:MAG: formyl-CoA transferase [Candidatus Tectomicrobia bacterium]
MQLPLEDVKVLDLSHALAGPFCSTMLADFGAQVVKLEPPNTGDIARAWGPPFYGSETAYFVSLHRNKKSIEVNLKHPAGRELFFRLVERFDVVLENFRPGTLDKLGIGYAQARARNPGIIYCSVSGFGQSGPYRDRAALDLIVQAESGMISITGEPGSRGVRCGVSIADMVAGMNAAFGILNALRVKEKTGQGQYIDVSMLEGQLWLLHGTIGAYLADGEVPRPMGTAYKALLPYQTFRTKTRDLALAVGSGRLWRIFCPLVGLEELMDDPRYATNAARNANRESLIARLQEVFLTKTYEEWEELFLAHGIPVGAINTIDRVVEHPQVQARQVLVEVEHPVAGPVKVVGPPVKLSATPATVREPAPLLGQHTDQVLRQYLGLEEAEMAALRAAGAIGKRHPYAAP